MRKLRVFSLASAALIVAGCFGGCGGGGASGGNQKKTELKIGVFNGGLGYAWADQLAEEFEEKYKDVSFEPGKTGVDVIIDPQKELFKVDSIKAALQQNTSANDIYYTCYRFFKEFANSKLVYNLNDIVNEKVYLDNGELADMTYNPETKSYELKDGAEAPTKSLKDKMGSQWQNAYYYDDNSGIEAGYYALPYETSLEGFIYDYDLFKDQGWLDYSGIDGTPGTMDEFFDLLDRIVEANMIPFTYKNGDYWAGISSAYLAQYEGTESAALNYTYKGEYTFRNLPQSTLDVFTDAFCAENGITNNNDGTYTVTITPSNAWLLAYQSGKDSYIKFMRNVIDPEYYDTNRYQQSYDYLMAQTTFVLSKLGKKTQKRIAMIVEGEWWENEARANFNYTGGYGTRDFRFMIMPKMEGQYDNSVQYIGGADIATDMVVNAKTDKIELCKLWLHFSHSERALEEFTLTNGVVRDSFEYDLSDEQLNSLTPFGRNVYRIKKGVGAYGNVKTIYPATYTDQNAFYASTPMSAYGKPIASTAMGAYGTYAAVGTYMSTWFADHAGVNGKEWISAETFITGVHDYYDKSRWELAFSQWQINGA